MTHNRLTLSLCAALLVFTLTACSGSSSPTEPAPISAASASMTVSSLAGQLVVVDHGCGSQLDVSRIAAEIDTTLRIAERQNPDVFAAGGALQGFEVHARPANASQQRCDAAACFEPAGGSGRLHVWCDGGGVEHEAAHALTWAVRLPCWESIYHTTNFRCERTSDLYGA